MNGIRSAAWPISDNKVKKNGLNGAKREANDRLPDDVGWRILVELQEDGRLPFAELGRRVGLSTPAVIERVRRLEEAGIITGYHAAIDPARIGRGITAIVRIRAMTGESSARMHRIVADVPEIVEAHHVTGDDCLSCKLYVGSVGELERVIGELAQHGSTTTSIVLSSPVARRIFTPAQT